MADAREPNVPQEMSVILRLGLEKWDGSVLSPQRARVEGGLLKRARIRVSIEIMRVIGIRTPSEESLLKC
jgi:hypothetical protein